MLKQEVNLFCDTCLSFPEGARPGAVEVNGVRGRTVQAYVSLRWGPMGFILPEGWLFDEATAATNAPLVFCSVGCQRRYLLVQARSEAGEKYIPSTNYGWQREIQCFRCSTFRILSPNRSRVYPDGWGQAYLRTLCQSCATPENLAKLKRELEKDRHDTVPEEEWTQ